MTLSKIAPIEICTEDLKGRKGMDLMIAPEC